MIPMNLQPAGEHVWCQAWRYLRKSPQSGSVKPLSPIWNWESTGTNGGKIVGSCKTATELGQMITKLAEHPETEQIRIGKFRRDYNPMISPEKMAEIIYGGPK
jgi:hypothetical protein